ncbi:hypothetical protein V496_06559 [Pseudogymnoascus sp. VKM F-4515 (FW-2607)]|nr:hypothetical protein V496_06559 [Pseudogymnoascus sp. VKM F-4515 (FW-2607)]
MEPPTRTSYGTKPLMHGMKRLAMKASDGTESLGIKQAVITSCGTKRLVVRNKSSKPSEEAIEAIEAIEVIEASCHRGLTLSKPLARHLAIEACCQGSAS